MARIAVTLCLLALSVLALAQSQAEDWPFDASGRSINIRDGELRRTRSHGRTPLICLPCPPPHFLLSILILFDVNSIFCVFLVYISASWHGSCR